MTNELNQLSRKFRRGTITAAEEKRLAELERAEPRVTLPPARTVWDLPVARACFEADRADGWHK